MSEKGNIAKYVTQQKQYYMGVLDGQVNGLENGCFVLGGWVKLCHIKYTNAHLSRQANHDNVTILAVTCPNTKLERISNESKLNRVRTTILPNMYCTVNSNVFSVR